MMDQAPNKHTTDKAANRLQLPLQRLIELAADVRRRMLEGASLSLCAQETVSIGLSAQVVQRSNRLSTTRFVAEHSLMLLQRVCFPVRHRRQ